MSTLPWTPWHQVVKLREDVRSGDLSLNIFAADLYSVVMGNAQPVYQNPSDFFALTYPTVALRDLARDVAHRLAGRNDKAVRQLELTYGGGKTHTLITLYHLTHDPAHLPADLPTIQEFAQHIGIPLPRARSAVLAFDKLDVEKGMEITSPDGERRWLRQPWSILAWQLAGAEGLRLLHPDNLDEERASAPAENLLTLLLAIPQRENMATLILIDEVLMYAREKIGLDPRWRDTLVNFFQYLTQAAVKARRCAVVASLLATDPRKADTLGREITFDLAQVFTREQEEPVQPVQKEDAAEVLRRRFFTPQSIRDRNTFRPHVVAAAQGLFALDEQSARDRSGTEERLLASYPFDPALTDTFYIKWTNLAGFQRTRGVLRTFALALRDAESWDQSPLVGVNVFLSPPGTNDLSAAASALADVAATEEYEGRRHAWRAIVEGELTKARDIQQEVPSLSHREIEQVVFATFLHSQPIGQRASTRDLLLQVSLTRPGKIDLEKGLHRWTETSWFLDETILGEGQPSARTAEAEALPKFWRLGSKPNLRQMHHDARGRVNADIVEVQLLEAIRKVTSLTTSASAAGVRVHLLPKEPSDLQDDGEFHFAILGPRATSEADRPSGEAIRFLGETTSSDRPRVYKNALILAVPSRDGLEAARNAIRDHLAWQDVQAQLKVQESAQQSDPIRAAALAAELNTAQQRIPTTIRQAYCIVVTVGRNGEPTAFKITLDKDPLFATIKADSRSRITETAVAADALLPGGPYDLWREGEPTRRVKDLVGAFAQYPRLPKMLNTQAILDTLITGCREGTFVLQVPRPDRSLRTLWREPVDDAALGDPALEAALPEGSVLTSLAPSLLAPQALPDLWSGPELTFAQLAAYFSGKVVQVAKGGYTEPVMLPRASRETLEAAVRDAVKAGYLWLTAGPTSLYQEDVPAGVITDETLLQASPQPVPARDILPEALPEAWNSDQTTARAVADALATKAGKPLPWTTVRQALDGAFAAGYLVRAEDSGPWPCDAGGASAVRTHLPAPVSGAGPRRPEPPKLRPGVLTAEADLRPNEIQDLADQMGELTRVATAAGISLTFHLRVEVSNNDEQPSREVLDALNARLREVSSSLALLVDARPGTPR